MPEFIAPQDGAEKQDCERNAAKRWLSTHGKQVQLLRPVYLGDALLSSQPLDERTVNWLGVTITDETGKATYDGAFVTSLPLTADNVVEVAACARARWKIEHESFNVLKNNGYNLAHNFGHGKKYLARTFAAMNLLAFALHTACDCLETLWQQPARRSERAHASFRISTPSLPTSCSPYGIAS